MTDTPRCCLCRRPRYAAKLEETDLPGSGFRCVDRQACTMRVRDIVSAHKAFGEI